MQINKALLALALGFAMAAAKNEEAKEVKNAEQPDADEGDDRALTDPDHTNES